MGKKRDYHSFTGKRSDVQQGPIRERNIQTNPLPPVGTYVIVNELHVFERTLYEERVLTVFKPDMTFVDSWGFPVAFKVVGYTNDDPLDPMNKITLERVINEGTKNERVFRTSIMAIWVATGSMYLEVVPKGFRYKTKEIDYRNCRVAEHGLRQYNKKSENTEDE